MRLSNVFLALAAGLLMLSLLAAERASAACVAPAGDCCAVPDEAGIKVFDDKRETEESFVPEAKPAPAPTPLDLKAEKVADAESYEDVFVILKGENSCSEFYGGPAKAVTAFNQFERQLRKAPLGTGPVAVRMSGQYTNYHDHLTGASYRLFDVATINSSGPFFSRSPSSLASKTTIGRFPANTREGRALILLHELGHLVEGADGKWLLPNDGNDPAQSDRNTETVEAHCVGQLLNLKY
jgi:hypothetical protein